MDINVGDKVHYTAPHGATQNGIVKKVEDFVFVVFHCNGEWDKYMDYTGQATRLQDITPGWVNENN